MTVLALKFSSGSNGVSKLHGHVARKMWNWLYPDKPQDAVPITSITNGIHTATWLAPELRELFDAYMGADWERNLDDVEMWKKIYDIPNDVLWSVRLKLKNQLILFVRERTRMRNVRFDNFQPVSYLMDPNILTIGFARRFATYKRATLIFRDPERLKALLNHYDRPVQMIFAGKAHPADDPGKHFIQQVYQFSHQPGFAGRIIFLEEYDMRVGRQMVQGADIWLNNPRRPHEASGTSGEKASLNGVVNLSILDGWWPEAFNGKNGWAIGEGREFAHTDEQDWHDAQSLYHLLEQEIIPLFYSRDAHGVAQQWAERCKEAIASIAPAFSTRRMLAEYTARLYMPAG
jgi:starch phosphorylase